jgi:hypothetical protein
MLYFIAAGGRLKIGRSKDPFQRVKTIQTGNPEPCRVLLALDLDNAELVEAILHERLSHARKEGEWFEVTFERAFNELVEARPQMVFRGQKELGLVSPRQPELEECVDEFRSWWSTEIDPEWVETELLSLPYLWGEYRKDFFKWKVTGGGN